MIARIPLAAREGRGATRVERARRGGALAIALIVGVTLAAGAGALLLFTMHFTRRQANAVHDQRAFYLAEAGLSEAYQAVVMGQSGRIGSQAGPVASGEGLFWVDSTRNADGTVELESTALVGLGRSSLSIVVERTEEPLGIFADEDIVIDAPLLVDGYDSEAAPYEEQVELPSIAPDPARIVYDNEVVSVVCVSEPNGDMFYDYLRRENGVYYYKDTEPRLSMFDRTWEARERFDARQADGETTIDVTTGGGGRLATNGSVYLSAPDGMSVAVFGDVIPGPEGRVVAGDGVTVSGHTQPRSEPVELDPVEAPPVTMLPAVEHGGVVPLVIPPSTLGYEALRVLPDADLVIQGPSTVVLGTLELHENAALFVENLGGPVDLYVTQAADLKPGSILQVESQDTSQLTLRLVGAPTPVRLGATSEFRGMIYGPEAEVAIELPFELYGALVARRFELAAGVRLHYDSGVAGGGGRLSLPTLVAWDVTEVPPEFKTRRMTPLEALEIEADDVLTLEDSVESYSWTVRVDFVSVSTGKLRAYEGPFEGFLYEDVGLITDFRLDPPDVDFGESWTVYIRYLDWTGTETDWTGPVEDYLTGVQVFLLLERVLTPPPGLAELGIEGSHYLR